MNGSKVTYHQQVSYCGKPRCRKCREGTGHGPYWYAYQTVDGRTTRTYVGKHLPPEIQAQVEGQREPSVHSKDLERSIIRIYVLGQFRLERRNPRDPLDWQTVTESAWQHQRVRNLLGCLVSVSGRKLGREQLMDALWPDLDLETAASRLDRAVYSLRQLFEPGRNRPATSPLLLTEREMLVLSEHPQIWIDADAFEHLLSQAHTSQDTGEKERLLEEAAQLYGGDFLPEERKNEWTLARRETLQRSWIGLLLDLADLRIERGFLDRAIEPLDRLLSIDPTNEAAVQRLISLLAQLGRRGEALRAYKRLATVLQQEYRIAPLPETRSLYEAVRAGVDSARLASPLARSADKLREQEERTRTPAASASELAAVQIGRSQQSSLVGREQELATLHNLVSTTEQATRFRLAAQKRSTFSALDTQKRPQCALLMGDVGIGKTRLAEEVSREARRHGWAIAWSRVYAQEGSIPYRLWTEVLRKAMAQGAWKRQEISNKPLVFQPLAALLPELHELLPPAISYTSSLPPEQEQLRLWEAARELLCIISEGTPLVIALDDLQWADGSSCELLAYLARRIQGHPILIVGTCRDNELAPNHALRPLLTDLQRENAIESIQLQPLSDEQIVSLVSQVPHLPEPLVLGIRTRAAGNPFFAEELARTIGTQLIASGIADTLTAEELETQLPETITAVLDLRLARLTQPCQNLLRKAAVLGSSFQFQVINAMEASTPGSSEDIVLDLLEEGLRSGMLTEEGIGTNINYHFWHPLLQSHLHEGLSAARRASLHRRAAEIFRTIYQNREEEGAATITNHLIQGGSDSQQILHYAELAGNRAFKLSSFPDAEKYYRIALEHLRASWAMNASTDKQLHLAYLLECLGECTGTQSNFEEARSFYEQALQARRQQYTSVPPDDMLLETQIQALLWCEVGSTWYHLGNNVQAQQYYKQSEQVLREANITTGSAWAYLLYNESHLIWRVGNYEEARQIALEALKLFENALHLQDETAQPPSLTRIRRILAGDSVNIGKLYVLLGIIDVSIGQYKEALYHMNEALTLHEKNDSLREIAIVCCDLGNAHLQRAEYSAAQAFLRRCLNLAEQVGEKMLVSFAFGNLGILDLRMGNLVEAEAELRSTIIQAEHINDLASVSGWGAYLAIALQEQYKISDAGMNLHRALTIGRTKNMTPYTGRALVSLGSMRVAQAASMEIEQENSTDSHESISQTLRKAKKTLQHALSLEGLEAETITEGKVILSQVLLLLGEFDNALNQAIQALEDAQRFEQIWLEAGAKRVLGNILMAQGKYEQATSYFDQALRTFRKIDMPLEQAYTLQQYGQALLQQDAITGKEQQKGLSYLQDALQIFTECKAELGMRMVERVLARYEQVSRI